MTTPARSAGPGRPPPGGKRRAYKTAGLVLRSDAIGDADRIATTLTPGFGKLRLAVRGARRATSKIGGHLAMLNVANLDVAVGSTFDVITGAEAVIEDVALLTYATPRAVKDELAGDLAEAGVPVTLIGDCLLPRDAASAIHDGHRAALAL